MWATRAGRGQGVGNALVAEHATLCCAAWVSLTVADSDRAARDLYRRMGPWESPRHGPALLPAGRTSGSAWP
jgi:ribosomal protein S18 acetylase RimI-like enzyme